MKPYFIGPSNIEGKGVIATRALHPSESVGEGIRFALFGVLPYVTDEVGKWINHSYSPNCGLEWRVALGRKPAWHIITLQRIPRGAEMTLDYRYTPWYIQGPLAHYI